MRFQNRLLVDYIKIHDEEKLQKKIHNFENKILLPMCHINIKIQILFFH